MIEPDLFRNKVLPIQKFLQSFFDVEPNLPDILEKFCWLEENVEVNPVNHTLNETSKPCQDSPRYLMFNYHVHVVGSIQLAPRVTVTRISTGPVPDPLTSSTS